MEDDEWAESQPGVVNPEEPKVTAMSQRHTSSPSEEELVFDKPGDEVCRKNELLNNRYKVMELLGKGSFGTIMSGMDIHADRIVALKFIKAHDDKFLSVPSFEVEILAEVYAASKLLKTETFCVNMLDTFIHDDYNLCIVFEALGKNLFHHIVARHYKPYSMDCIRQISQQLCQALTFLHKNEIVHGDIKLGNVLFVNDNENAKEGSSASEPCPDIRLIDFGLSWHRAGNHMICTQAYRSPEIILKLRWSYPSDIWSLGCLMFHLFWGHPLFPTVNKNHAEHLAMMERTLGPIPLELLCSSPTKFYRNGILDWDHSTAEGEYVQDSCFPLHVYMEESEDESVPQFHDLLTRMLDYDFETRITAEEALGHPFFKKPDLKAISCMPLAEKKAGLDLSNVSDPIHSAGHAIRTYREVFGEAEVSSGTLRASRGRPYGDMTVARQDKNIF